MQALSINRGKQNNCLKSENPQPMVVTILPPCSGKQMWMWCSVVSSPAWWLITLSPIPEAARCQLLLRAGQLRYLIVSARKLPPKLQCQEVTSNGSWCIGIKGEMSGTVCVTFTWDIYIYIWVVYSSHSLLSPRWVNTSSSCWRQTRTPPSRTPALLGLGWIPLDLGAFNLGLIAPVTALTLGYRSAWSPGTALSHLGSASLVAQGLYSDIGLKT